MIGVENFEEGQIVDNDQMIRIIYLQQLNAQIDIIYFPSQKTTLTSALVHVQEEWEVQVRRRHTMTSRRQLQSPPLPSLDPLFFI